MSLRTASISALITIPSPASWTKIRTALDAMTDDAVLSLPKPKILFKDWPTNLSRPPLKTWTAGNPRLAFCLQCREVDTYDSYRLAAAGIGCQLMRQAVGAYVPWATVEKALIALRGGRADAALKILQGARPHAIGVEGLADLGGYMVMPDGRAACVQVEVKMATGTESDEQTHRREVLLSEGVCAIVAKTPDEMLAQIGEWVKRKCQHCGSTNTCAISDGIRGCHACGEECNGR